MLKPTESFVDYYNRLFPPVYDKNIDVDNIKATEKKMPRTITFQVTDACNLRCTYCYEINKSNHVMSFDVAKKFIDDLLDEDKENGYINPKISPAIILEFIGGEPLLEIDLIDKIVDYFREQTIIKHHPWATTYILSMCSNGVLYFNDNVQKFIKKNFTRLSFSISIDGNKKLHDTCRIFPNGKGSYDIAIKAVKHFTEVLHGNMGSKMTLAPQNVMYTCEAVKNLIDLGYKEILLNCAYEEGWTNKEASALYYQLKELSDYIIDNDLFDKVNISMFTENIGYKIDSRHLDNWCGGTGSMTAVDYKGDIFPCLRYMESSLGKGIKPLIIGTVKDGIMKTKEQCNCVECLRKVDRRTQSTDECFNCPIGEGCAWCSAYNYQKFGTVDHRATFICCMHKARVLANSYLWNKIYLMRKPSLVFKNNVPDEWALDIIDKEELNMLKNLEKR